jgi:hypothetical protein
MPGGLKPIVAKGRQAARQGRKVFFFQKRRKTFGSFGFGFGFSG